MNTITAYEKAIEIAKRFIYEAKGALNALERDEYARFGNKHIASAKRASMDLTRILVEVRKPFKQSISLSTSIGTSKTAFINLNKK